MKKKLIIFGVVAIIILLIGTVFFNLPQRIGLVKSPVEKLLAARLDEQAAVTMLQELKAAGVNTQGLSIYVIPYRNSNENLAVAVLDASKGFNLRNFGDEGAVTKYLEMLASLDKGGKYDIKRVAVDYKNEQGQSLLTLTAPTDTITRYASGTISREQFLNNLEGQVNFVEVAKILAGEVR
jgi:hypothetical protein